MVLTLLKLYGNREKGIEMKKIFLLISALLMTVSVFAQSSAGLKMPDELILELTYDNADAESVFVSGTFNGWDTSASPMTKNDAGIWVLELPVKVTDNITYKYFVDGEYLPSMEGLAPSTVEDGYGGKNGTLAIADLTGPSEGDEEVFRTKLSFGNYTKIYFDNHFRTNSIAPDEDGNYTKGFETSESKVGGSSYWKFTADILPGIDTFMEVKVFDGNITLFEQAPDASADEENEKDPTVDTPDGMQKLGEMLFGPFYTLNGDNQPELGHFKAGLKTPYVNLSTGYKNAKSDITSRDLIYRTFENDASAGDGFLEISNGSKIQNLGDLGLNTTVALTRRAGGHGIYSWIDLLGVGPADISVNYSSLANRLSENELEYYAFDAYHTFGLGVNLQNLVPEVLNIKAEAVTTYDPITDYDAEEAIAAGLAGDFSAGSILSVEFNAKWAGDDVKLPFGDEGEDGLKLDKGLFVGGLKPTVTPSELLSITVDYDMEIAKDFSGDLTNSFNPSVDLTLGSVLPLDTTVNIYNKMSLVADTFDFTEVGGTVTLKEVAMFSELATGYTYDMTSEDSDYYGIAYVSGHTEKLDIEVGYKTDIITATAAYDVMDNTVVNGGIIYRSEDDNNVFGAAVGGIYTLSDELRNGSVFVQMGYQFDPYNGPNVANIEYDGNYLKNTGGEDDAYFSLGVKWDF